MARPISSPRWVFDRFPSSGARRGGDPSEHAFHATLETFVREVVQNANDQAIDGARRRSEVHFDYYDLTGHELEDFLAALNFQGLAKHLSASALATDNAKLKDGLKAARKSLAVLKISDFYTHGLTGEEDDEQSHFRSLCKDTLLSYKQGESAGGSYGLGKSVLWSFSSLSTVLFSSTFKEAKEQRLPSEYLAIRT